MEELTEIEIGDEEYVPEPDESSTVADSETGEPVPETAAVEPSADEAPADGAAESDALTQEVHELVRLLTEQQESDESEGEPEQVDAEIIEPTPVELTTEQMQVLVDTQRLTLACSCVTLVLVSCVFGLLLWRQLGKGVY